MDAIDRYLEGETDDLEIVWAHVVAPKAEGPRRRPAVARIQRSDGTNARKNQWLLAPPPPPATVGIRRGPPPPDPEKPTAEPSPAGGIRRASPATKIRPAPAALITAAEPPPRPKPQIVQIETLPPTLRVIKVVAPPPTTAALPLRPTGPQPPPDIPVELEPGRIISVPHFAVHVARKYKVYEAGGIWTLRFTRTGQLRVARYKAREG